MNNLSKIQRLKSGIIIAISFGFGWSTSCLSYAYEFDMKPSIAVSEEYTDNVFSTKDNTIDDFITHVQPGFNAMYNTPFWDWTIGYILNYRYYAYMSRKDDTSHVINANGLVKLIPDRLFLSLKDSYKRISLDTTRDFTQESDFKNQSDSNNAEISSYVIFHPGDLTEIKLQYAYQNLWYKDVPGSNTYKHSTQISCYYDLAPRLKATSNYTFELSGGSEVEAGNKRNEILAGVNYEYASDSKFTASGGYSWLDYDNGHSSVAPVWNLGVSHAFDTLSASLTTSVRYVPDPLKGTKRDTSFLGSISRKFERTNTNLGLSYKEYVDEPSSKLEKITYGGNFSADTRLTERLSSKLFVSFTRFDDKLVDTYSNLLSTNLGFTYEVYSNIFLDFNYSYIDGYSPILVEDTNTVNRFMLTVRATW